MKRGTVYATQVKKAYAKVRESIRKPEIPEPGDPLECLAAAVLGVAGYEDEAEEATARLLSAMVDWNEIRVSSAPEVSRAMGDRIPNAAEHAQRLIDALQAIYDRENRISLDRLKSIGRREARQYLEELDGVDDYVAASILLWSLGGHGIPVSDRLLQALRDADLVHPTAERGEVQAFLERHISASEAKEFCLVMRSFAPDKPGERRRPAARASKASTGRGKSAPT